jgi:hypothetical protein
MPTDSKWLTLLKLIYVFAFSFLLVMVVVTAYGLSHPELGLEETNPLIRAYMAAYGLVGALLIALLVNVSVLIFAGLFFTLYRMFQRRYNWHHPLIDAIAYSIVATFGLYALITWLLNAVNDVSWLLFYSCPDVITATWDLWMSLPFHLTLAIFGALFPIVYYSMRKEERP